MAPVQDRREMDIKAKTTDTYEYAEHTRRKEGGNHVAGCAGSFKGRDGKVPFGIDNSGN